MLQIHLSVGEIRPHCVHCCLFSLGTPAGPCPVTQPLLPEAPLSRHGGRPRARSTRRTEPMGWLSTLLLPQPYPPPRESNRMGLLSLRPPARHHSGYMSLLTPAYPLHPPCHYFGPDGRFWMRTQAGPGRTVGSLSRVLISPAREFHLIVFHLARALVPSSLLAHSHGCPPPRGPATSCLWGKHLDWLCWVFCPHPAWGQDAQMPNTSGPLAHAGEEESSWRRGVDPRKEKRAEKAKDRKGVVCL